MEPNTQQTKQQASEGSKPVFGLPPSVYNPRDVRRLINEIDALDNTLLQLGLRQPGSEVKLPRTSRLLDELVAVNGLNLLQENDRHGLKTLLEQTIKQAPLLHISFAADPSPSFIDKLILWFRDEIHPLTLITVGLQPNIGAGCVVRTTNKYFDLSLRQDFIQKKDLLKQALDIGAKA